MLTVTQEIEKHTKKAADDAKGNVTEIEIPYIVTISPTEGAAKRSATRGARPTRTPHSPSPGRRHLRTRSRAWLSIRSRSWSEDQILNRLFVRWFREWQLANPDTPLADSMSPWQGHWIWPHTDDLVMLNAAHVQTINLQNKTTTLATEYARQGKNWKTELEQIKKEQAYLKHLGLT